MKKLLTILGAVGLTATTGAIVVACGNENPKVKEDAYQKALNKTFNVEVDSFNSTKNPWGENSIGAFYASLWSINNKPAIKDGYDKQNKDIEAILTKGESIKRAELDDGHNVTINDKLVKDLIKEGQDWHTLTVKNNDVIKFNVDVLEYIKGTKGKEFNTHNVNITIKIVNIKIDMILDKITIQGAAEFGREIYNYDSLQNLKVVLEMTNPNGLSLISVELKDKQLWITNKIIDHTVNGKITLTADNIDTTVIDLSVLKDSGPLTF